MHILLWYIYRNMEKQGPDWHHSQEKLALESALLHIAAPMIATEVSYCMAIGNLSGKKIICQERVDTWDLDEDVITHLPVIKMQTLERGDMPLHDGKKSEQDLPELISHFRRTAGDEALQILQATWDTSRPGRLALISTRPQMTEELLHMGAVMSDAGHFAAYRSYVER